MSAPARQAAGSRQARTGPRSKTPLEQLEQEIANLAYALWQRRGCPDGSPEEEWREAEQILRAERPSAFHRL